MIDILDNLTKHITYLSPLLIVLKNDLNSDGIKAILNGKNLFQLIREIFMYFSEQKSGNSQEKLLITLIISAYIKSLKEFLENHPEYKKILEKNNRRKIEKIQVKNTLINFKSSQIKETLECLHQSNLGKIFTSSLEEDFKNLNLSDKEVKVISQRVIHRTHFYILEILFEEMDESEITLLSPYIQIEWKNDLNTYKNLKKYLECEISSNPNSVEKKEKWRVFQEDFFIPDIYVSLNAQILDEGNKTKTRKVVNLKNWTTEVLQEEKKQNRIIFIQASPGRGKSVFCKMFASFIYENFYPIWTPILIELKNVDQINVNIETLLKNSIGYDITSQDNWLRNCNRRFLFILDGFDELILEQRSIEGLRDFLVKLYECQNIWYRDLEKKHRILITGRTMALQGIESRIPPEIERVEILTMDNNLQEEWLKKWKKLHPCENISLLEKLIKEDCPNTINQIAREPLLLYLLAKIYKDFNNQEQEDVCTTLDDNKGKIYIYNKAIDWVLSQRPTWMCEDVDNFTRKLILQELGLCVTQFGGESAPVIMLEERLKENNAAQEILKNTRTYLEDNPIRNTFVYFYIQAQKNEHNKQIRQSNGQVEFTHRSFGEFLCATRLKNALVIWTIKSGIEELPGFYKPDDTMYWEIYDLMGYGNLSQEIVQDLIDLLIKELDHKSLNVLFGRLQKFYIRWSYHEFIQAESETFPQRKSRQLKRFSENAPGQLEIDIYAGLNILILLLSLNSYAKESSSPNFNVNFNPCYLHISDKENENIFDPNRLLKIIHYTESLRPSAFTEIVGGFLQNVCLEKVNLARVDFNGANLRQANLSESDLRRADFTQANLQQATLKRTYLRGADLSGTDLRNADLTKADLRRVFLHEANLIGANLYRVTLNGADLRGALLYDTSLEDTAMHSVYLDNIKCDNGTKWIGIIGLHQASGIPPEVKDNKEYKDAITFSQGIEALKNGNNPDTIQKAFDLAIKYAHDDDISAKLCNRVCWLGSLYNNAHPDILHAGLKAVKLDPTNGNYQDTLGVALALAGRAIVANVYADSETVNHLTQQNYLILGEDYLKSSLEAFKKVIKSQFFKDMPSKFKQRRIDWIRELEAGNNPFTPEVLKVLRKDEM